MSNREQETASQSQSFSSLQSSSSQPLLSSSADTPAPIPDEKKKEEKPLDLTKVKAKIFNGIVKTTTGKDGKTVSYIRGSVFGKRGRDPIVTGVVAKWITRDHKIDTTKPADDKDVTHVVTQSGSIYSVELWLSTGGY